MIRALLFASGWLAGWVLLWRPARLGPAPPDPRAEPAADLSVVIPARNEEAVVGRLLDSLSSQHHPPAAVIVVDDQSTDATAAVARAHPVGAEVVAGSPPPPGWVGKPWAMAQGLERVRSDRVLFLDADTELAADALAALAGEHDRRGGLVSVAPTHVPGSAVEVLSAPFNVVALAGSEAALAGANGRARAAFGPCVLLSRDDLRRLGGIEAIRGEVLDDVALAGRAREAGIAVWCGVGGETVRYRMYPRGLGQLVEGWTKNIAAGAGKTRPLVGAGVAGWLTATMSPLAAGASAAAVLAWALVAGQAAVLYRRVGRFGWWAPLAAPVLGVFFAAVFTRSLLRVLLRRPVRWRGRSVPSTST